MTAVGGSKFCRSSWAGWFWVEEMRVLYFLAARVLYWEGWCMEGPLGGVGGIVFPCNALMSLLQALLRHSE